MRLLNAMIVFATVARAEMACWISWPEFAAEVAAQNGALAAARARVAQARFAAAEAEAAFRPSLSASASLRRADRDSADAATRSAAGVDARYVLYAGGSDRARLQKARAERDAAEAEYDAVRAAIGAEARRAYVRLLFAQERLALAEKIAERRRQNVDLVRLRYEAGAENKGALLRVEAAAEQAAADVAQARRELPLRQRELSALAGREGRIRWVARDALEPPSAPEEPEWGALARSLPAVRSAAARAESARAAARAARGARQPEIALQANLQREGENASLDREGWSIGATVAVPLYTGGGLPARIFAAESAARAAELDADEQRRAVLVELERAYAEVWAALDQVRVQRAFLEAAETRAEIARAQYANGLLSFQTWDQIEDELIASQQNVLARVRDAALAAAEWDRAQGRSPLPEDP